MAQGVLAVPQYRNQLAAARQMQPLQMASQMQELTNLQAHGKMYSAMADYDAARPEIERTKAEGIAALREQQATFKQELSNTADDFKQQHQNEVERHNSVLETLTQQNRDLQTNQVPAGVAEYYMANGGKRGEPVDPKLLKKSIADRDAHQIRVAGAMAAAKRDPLDDFTQRKTIEAQIAQRFKVGQSDVKDIDKQINELAPSKGDGYTPWALHNRDKGQSLNDPALRKKYQMTIDALREQRKQFNQPTAMPNQ